MTVRAIHVYVALICALAASSMAAIDWMAIGSLPIPSLVGLAALAFVGFLTEKLALEIRVGSSAGGGSSITFIPVLASIVLFGPSATIAYMLVTGCVAEFIIKKKAPLKASFNVAQYVVSASLAGWAFVASGGSPLAADSSSVADPVFVAQLGPFVAFGVVFLGANHLAVSLAIALSQQMPFGRVWRALIGSSGTNIFYDLLVSPIALAVAVFYLEWWLGGLAVTLLPLLFIRHSYLTVFKLQQANRDLLKALVKAIETRDPYTSGHSLRVSDLAGRIAEALRLPARKIESVKTAALLHDIGKIEAIYADILSKPGSLSDEERTIIESHVTKGVELLTSMGSFDSDVVLAVKHHHEWMNGNGYPDGLADDEIPLGARIIKICDAIDAMLSDRPYRKALSLPQVLEQLEIYAGTQFDGELVGVIVGSRIVEAYASEMRMVRALEEANPQVPPPTRTRLRTS